MKKRVVVLSLGGSLIIPEDIDTKFLKKFKKVIKANTNKYKFVIVCGGGSIARKYIKALQEMKSSEKLQNLSGISVTRMNARFMNYFFDIDSEKGIPHKLRNVKKQIKKREIVFCGGLQYKPHQTSDSTAAKIASYFNSPFINLTNVKGLYDKNPKKHKGAKFIPWIPWKEFHEMTEKISFQPGQHFVLDQKASEIIMKNQITTYITGKNLDNLNNLLKGKKFKGTTIEGTHEKKPNHPHKGKPL